jgi:4-amino-4-deoxy-L-arabinose transferase-like glycosyltransferase
MALLVTITMILAYRWRDRPRWSTAAWLGGMIALAALARGEAILLIPLLAVPWVLLTRSLTWRAAGDISSSWSWHVAPCSPRG